MNRGRKAVFAWLWAVYLGVLLMVVVGGITRLTGSGLSMVEWKPVSGILPPLSQDAWLREFDAYRASPQGRLVNAWMSVDDFQKIFFWEYLHRVLGRLEFFVAFVPWLFWRKKPEFRDAVASFRAPWVWILVILQGVLGWLMVKSGLSREPAVSHFRLAAHLSLAFFLGEYVLFQALRVRALAAPVPSTVTLLRRSFLKPSLVFLALLCLQIVYGAFMGGKRAGHMYSSFPDMAGEYLPSSTFFTGNLSFDFFHSPAGIHYIHRALAWVVLGVGLWLGLRLLRTRVLELKFPASALLATLVAQVALGAATVMTNVSIPMAVLHQAVAFLVLSAVIAVLEVLLRPVAVPTDS